MQGESFKIWLVTVRGLNERTAGSRLSNCKRVEANEGDPDKQWGGDGLAALIGRLTYSKEDERSGKRPKHRIEIVGDVYPNVANNLYPIVGKSPISQDLVSIFDCRSDSPQVRLNSTAIPTIRSLK